MRIRLAVLACLLALLVPAATAAAQDGNPFDGQLPAPQPTPAPTVAPIEDPDAGYGRETLWIIGGGVAIALLAFGFWITRDARSAVPQDDRRDAGRQQEGTPARLHRRERQAKAKARAKARAQRQARKAGRKRRARS